MICDWFKRETICGLALLSATGIAVMTGCITRPQNPAATQPATVADLATTQPTYWLAKPAVASANGDKFDAVWETCKHIARQSAFALDREDYRLGIISTAPAVSKQWFEPWRSDSGTAANVLANSTATIRRTLRFEIARNDDQTFTITPKVLIERETILERQVTDVSQYRTAFSGPSTKMPTREAVALDPDTYPDVPIKYWTPIGRDTEMEKQVAVRVQTELDKQKAAAIATAPRVEPTPPVAAGAPLISDGIVSAMGPDQTLYINIGSNDKVVPGMTFELYEARATLPTLENFSKDNALSKGWIEVVTVAGGNSICKVLKNVGNTPPKPGDQIFNFIFQRSKPNHFAVIGDFSAERETITGLIWRWNGVVDQKVTEETTYLILGQPPKDAPARKVYDTAVSQAQQLKTPIISEGKFDLLIRYYDPGKR